MSYLQEYYYYWLKKPARLTIVPDCQIRYKKTNSETVTLSKEEALRRQTIDTTHSPPTLKMTSVSNFLRTREAWSVQFAFHINLQSSEI